MGTTYEEKRKIIESSQVYALYHEQQQRQMIYVGATTNLLSRRKDLHINEVRKGTETPVYNYIREEVDDYRGDLVIEELDYGDEQDAIEAHPHTYNKRSSHSEVEYEGPEWTPERIKVLEDTETLSEAHRQLEVSWAQVRRAAYKLGLYEETRQLSWTDAEIEMMGTMTDPDLAEELGRGAEAIRRKRQSLGIDSYRWDTSRALNAEEVIAICTRYHLEDITQAQLAQEYDVSTAVIGKAIRGESYEDVPRPDLERLDEQMAAARASLH